MTKRLVAALAALRGRILLIEALVEEGDQRRAVEEIEQAEREWNDAVAELRAS